MTRPTYPSPHPRQQAGEAKHSREDAAQAISTLDSARGSVIRKARGY